MDGRGYCTVEGRLKDMIIRGGENIYPRELEELLFNLETAVGRARGSCNSVRGQGATTRRAFRPQD